VTALKIDAMAKPMKPSGNEAKPRALAPVDARAGGGLRPLAGTLDRLIARSGHKRGFAEARVLTDWRLVVGDVLAERTAPDRLARSRDDSGGTLHLRVANGWATDVQHLAPVIIERVNAFFGYRAVSRLTLRQGEVRPHRERPVPIRRALAPDEERALAEAVRCVDDPELAEALARLGRAVLESDPG